MYGKRKAAEILTDSHRYINVLKFRYCKVNHFRGDTQIKKPRSRSSGAGVKKISYYNLSAVILRRFAISTSAPFRRSRSMSLKSSGLPLLRPLNL